MIKRETLKHLELEISARAYQHELSTAYPLKQSISDEHFPFHGLNEELFFTARMSKPEDCLRLLELKM